MALVFTWIRRVCPLPFLLSHSPLFQFLRVHRYQQGWKYYVACQVLYKAAVGLAKTSMLLLYLRIFQTNRFRKAVWVVMFIVVGTAIGTIMPTIFQCTPIEKAWKPSVPGH